MWVGVQEKLSRNKPNHVASTKLQLTQTILLNTPKSNITNVQWSENNFYSDVEPIYSCLLDN